MKKWNYLLVGVLGITLIFGGTGGLAKSLTEKISARFANIKLIVNGQTINTKAEPFIYNGNVYAPVATIANLLGVKQEWDNQMPAVRFTDPNAKLKDPDGRTFDHPLGNGLHLVQSKTTEYKYMLEDRLNGKTISIPVPLELEGKSEGLIPITSALPQLDFFSDNSKYEFYIFQYGTGYGVFLQLLQYEKGKLTTLGATKVAENVNEAFGLHNNGRNSIYVQIHDKGELESSREYVWNHQTKSIQKVTELKEE